MVDPVLTVRPVASRSTSFVGAPSSRRSRSRSSFEKQLQTLIGPRIANARNAALLVIVSQALVIAFLLFTVKAKNNLLALAGVYDGAISSIPGGPLGYQKQSEGQFGVPPKENENFVQAALDEANYDDMSPAITGISEPKKYTTFLGQFTRCKPRPCNIDHWAYIGEKCFYRDDHVKDRAGHNSSIWTLVDPQEWMYSIENDFACPAVVCRHQWRQELNLTEHIVQRVLLEHYKNDTPWNLEDMYSGSKYFRVNPFWGLEYKLNGGFTLTRNAEDGAGIQENRTATITIRRGFTQKYCDVSVHAEVPPPEEPIYIVVPYTGRVEQLRLFYENIKELVDEGVSLRVIVATHGGPVHMLGAAELLREMQLGFSEGELVDGNLVQVIEALGDREGNFSRSRALMEGAKFVPASGLMFYCDVDMIIKKPFFDNCRYNTQRNYQVYYPVVYSLYPYGYKVSQEHGYWRKGAFGMVCGYKSDFKRTKAWVRAQHSLTGWGFEDVLLHKEFSNHWQISVFHAVEPNLLHRWHPKYCEFNLHIAACLGTVLQNMGSQRFLASIVADKGIDVRAIKYEPFPVVFSSYKNDSAGSSKRTLEMPAAESETDEVKLAQFRKVYEEAIKSGTGGLVSVFAKEAQEILLHANSEQSQLAHSNPNGAAAANALPPATAPPPTEQLLRNTARATTDQDSPAAPLTPKSPNSIVGATT